MKNNWMKYFLITCLAVVFIACKTVDVEKYEYRATTMLGTRVLFVTQDSVISSYSGRSAPTRTARATTIEEWTKLKAAAKTVDLNTIGGLESPTNRRATDAAAYGSIKITTKDSTYKSGTFDSYDSHPDLLPIMKVIKSMAQGN